ncbi:hypothetical protein [Nocardia sp. NPDC049149]|uniref:hypothetical protein n=1 Tax=Nocardia sp. NPDC049149 TaxID=3364315 RepID=UPI00371CD222
MAVSKYPAASIWLGSTKITVPLIASGEIEKVEATFQRSAAIAATHCPADVRYSPIHMGLRSLTGAADDEIARE